MKKDRESRRARLSVGSKIQFNGDAYEIVGFAGRVVELRSRQGLTRRESTEAVLTSETFKALDWLDDHEATEPIFDDNVEASQRHTALSLAAHLLEAMTGYRSGTEADKLTAEPAPEFDPERTTLAERFASKAVELNVSERTLWKKKALYQEHGVAGLLDRRANKLATATLDPRIQSALISVIDSFEKKSNPTKQRIRRLTEKAIRERYPEAKIEFPGETTFNMWIVRLSKGRALFGSAKQRRGNANRPTTPYSQFIASRPGEMIAIDSSPIDAFAMDPHTFEWLPVQVTIAIDLCTRSLVAWRFTPVSVKGVDAALLLFDILKPKGMRKGWSDKLRWNYVGVPEHIVIEVGDDAPGAKLAAIPFLHPESVIVDRGRVFISEAFTKACDRLGINLHIARPYTPTDKAHVERFFRTIREQFIQNLVGYKGPDVYSRGVNLEDEAFWFIDEIEDKFAEWVASWWQNRHHDGLMMPHLPRFEFSPNTAFEEGIARAGFVYAVPDANLYFELLPTEWRTIQHYGIEVRGLVYDGDCLDEFRNRKSDYLGVHSGKWPIRYDPRDRSLIYFYDPELEEWQPVLWRGHSVTALPFNEATVDYAKAKLIADGGNSNNHAELERVLWELLERVDVEQEGGRKSRRAAAVNAHNVQQAKRDRPRSPSPAYDDAESSLLGSDAFAGLADARSVGEDARDQVDHEEDRNESFRTVRQIDEDEDDDLVF